MTHCRSIEPVLILLRFEPQLITIPDFGIEFCVTPCYSLLSFILSDTNKFIEKEIEEWADLFVYLWENEMTEEEMKLFVKTIPIAANFKTVKYCTAKDFYHGAIQSYEDLQNFKKKLITQMKRNVF